MTPEARAHRGWAKHGYTGRLLSAFDGVERLGVLARSQDGFEIAREDLVLRGMGDFFGARQHGLPEFRFFDPIRDEDLVPRARTIAQGIIDEDPQLVREENAGLRRALEERFADRAALYEVG